GPGRSLFSSRRRHTSLSRDWSSDVSSSELDRGMLDAAYAPDGIRVRSLNATEDRRIREAHFDHGVHRLFRQGGNIPPIWSRSRRSEEHRVGKGWREGVPLQT